MRHLDESCDSRRSQIQTAVAPGSLRGRSQDRGVRRQGTGPIARPSGRGHPRSAGFPARAAAEAHPVLPRSRPPRRSV